MQVTDIVVRKRKQESEWDAAAAQRTEPLAQGFKGTGCIAHIRI
jgi:hypothetical protein